MPPLSTQQANDLLATLPAWQIAAGELVRTFQFEDFLAAMRFVNRVAELAEEAGHHPDIDIRYNRVRLALVTHDAGAPSDGSSSRGWDSGGLTSKDFDLAGRADKAM